MTISRTSAIDIQQIIQIDGTDTVFGTTRVTYGLSNRLYAKRKVGQLSQAQEIVAFDINQSYYVDARAAQFDSQYTTILGGASSPVLANNYSPIQLGLRASPSVRFNANLRGEIDSRYRTLRTLSANGNYTIPQHLQLSVGWSRKFFVPLTPGYDNLLRWITISTSEAPCRRATTSTGSPIRQITTSCERACCNNASRRSTIRNAAASPSSTSATTTRG